MKRTIAVALAAAMLVAATVALAAGWMFSDRADAKVVAWEALRAQYGFTPEMEGFFTCAVDTAAGTVVFSPVTESHRERLGEYTVALRSGGAQASWSHDGEAVGGDLSSPIWDTKLLARAIERKAAGEEWFEIDGLYTPAQLEIRVTREEAERIARQAVAKKYGADALEGFALFDAHAHVTDPEEVARDGHGLWRYNVSFVRENAETQMVESYLTRIYADDGSVFECQFKTERAAPQTRAESDPPEGYGSWQEYNAARAFPLAAVAPRDAIALAREAIVSRYGLSQAQSDALELHDGWTCLSMSGDTPVYDVWFSLWANPGEAWTPGDGLYGALVNAETGVIEELNYDSTLEGNG